MIAELFNNPKSFQDVRRVIGQIGYRGLQTYTPTWTATTTNPTIGNGGLRGMYWLGLGMCWATARITIGSTTTLGTGTYEMGLPVGPNVKDGVLQNHGSVICYDLSAMVYGLGVCQIGATGAAKMTLFAMAPSVTGAGETAVMTQAKPFAWQDSDWIEATIFYPVA